VSLAEIILGYASVYLAGFHAYKILPDAHWTEYNQMRLFAETVRNLAYSWLIKIPRFSLGTAMFKLTNPSDEDDAFWNGN